jgi:hypothetical protein
MVSIYNTRRKKKIVGAGGRLREAQGPGRLMEAEGTSQRVAWDLLVLVEG